MTYRDSIKIIPQHSSRLIKMVQRWLRNPDPGVRDSRSPALTIPEKRLSSALAADANNRRGSKLCWFSCAAAWHLWIDSPSGVGMKRPAFLLGNASAEFM